MLNSRKEVGKKTREYASRSNRSRWTRPFLQPPPLHSSKQQKKLRQSFPSRQSYTHASSKSCQYSELFRAMTACGGLASRAE